MGYSFVSLCILTSLIPIFTLTEPAFWAFNQLSSVFDPVACTFTECCRDAVVFNAERYYKELNEKLYGQHIAIERLYYHVKAHLEDPSPRRSLVLSLHGFTGVGKNYAVSILVSNLYTLAEKSQFYNFFDATINFLNKDSIEDYKAEVLRKIRQGVNQCEKSIFVFDEVHKMPSGILDAIIPLLGYTKSLDGVDYRKAIFLLIGNAGASVINEYVFNVLENGKRRTSIQYGDLRRTLLTTVYGEKGAFEFSNLVTQHVITAVVPFLPLQEVHVRQCIGDAARRMGVMADDEMKDFVVSELDWEPEGTHVFSASGCKLVYDKVGFYLQQRNFTHTNSHDQSPFSYTEL